MAIEEQMNVTGRATGRALLSDADNISTDFHLQRVRLAQRKSREETFATIHSLRDHGLSCSEIDPAAQANHELGLLDAERCAAIVAACTEIRAARCTISSSSI